MWAKWDLQASVLCDRLLCFRELLAQLATWAYLYSVYYSYRPLRVKKLASLVWVYQPVWLHPLGHCTPFPLSVCVCVCVCVCACTHRLSPVRLFVTPWTIAHQAPLSMGFPRQEYWSGLPFPSSENLPEPGTEMVSLVSPALSGRFFTTVLPGKPKSREGISIKLKVQVTPHFLTHMLTVRWELGLPSVILSFTNLALREASRWHFHFFPLAIHLSRFIALDSLSSTHILNYSLANPTNF